MTDGITIELPRVLGDMVGIRKIAGNGKTLGSVLTVAIEAHPGLRPHFFDEAGKLRKHIRFVINDAFCHSKTPLDVAVAPGDQVMVINSVSGG